MNSSAIRVPTQGSHLATAGVGGDEEEDGDADDEERVLQRGNGSFRSREVAMVKKIVSTDLANNRNMGVLLFVGNLPFKASIRWLIATFWRFGKIIDAFIPGKLSRGFGRKFGFVRFGDEGEAANAIRGMNGFLIGEWNLIVERAKPKSVFSVPKCHTFTASTSISNRVLPENFSTGIRQRAGSSPASKNPLASKAVSEIFIGEFLSHSDGKNGSRKQVAALPGQKDVSPSHAALSLAKGKFVSRNRILGVIKESDWDLCAAIAFLRNGMLFFDMRSVILETCTFVRSISLIKDNSVLIMFQSPDHRSLAIDHSLWAHWFYSVKAWGEGKAVGENRVWVECRGIPFYAWNEATFEAIANVWGSIVEVDPDTSDMVHLLFARFCISTNASAIDDIIELQVGDNFFDISVSRSQVQNNSLADMLSSYRKPYSLEVSQCMHYSSERVQSKNKVMQGKPWSNAVSCPSDPSLEVHFEKNNLGNADYTHSVFRPDGCCTAEISCMHESPKNGEDSWIMPHGDREHSESLGDVSEAVSYDDTVIQSDLQGVGCGVNDRDGCALKSDVLCEAGSKADIQVNQQKLCLVRVIDSHAEDVSSIQSPKAEGNVMVNVNSMLAASISLDFEGIEADLPGEVLESASQGVVARNEFKSEVIPGTTGAQYSNSNGSNSNGRGSVMTPESGGVHGVLGNFGSVSRQKMEYTKELVIPDKFSAMSGSLNISKSCFYALCNRLIEVIDEILDMSSDMGIPFSIEAQKGIKDVMTSRQTRALSMIMDNW